MARRGASCLDATKQKRGWIPGCHNLRCCTRYLSMRSSNSPCHAAIILAPFPGIHVGAELKHTHAVHLAARDCRAQRLPSAPVLVATRPRSTAACTTSLRTRDHSSKRQPPAAASPALAVPNRTFAQCRHCSSAAPAMPTSKALPSPRIFFRVAEERARERRWSPAIHCALHSRSLTPHAAEG